MNKKMLYLVQSRSKFAMKHLNLESEIADVLIYTFDKEIKGSNFIYKPNTSWGEGRDILIAAAKKMPYKYEFYTLLDDDVQFIKGSFREFEYEVIKIRPHVSMPLYSSSEVLRFFAKTIPFNYSSLIIPDCCFVCLAAELFFDERLLPYRNGLLTSSDFSHLPLWSSFFFWTNLCEYFWDKQIIVIQKYSYINSVHDSDYQTVRREFPKLFQILEKDNPSFKRRIMKMLPLYMYIYLIRDPMSRRHSRRKYLIKAFNLRQSQVRIKKVKVVMKYLFELFTKGQVIPNRRIDIMLFREIYYYKLMGHKMWWLWCYIYIKYLWRNINLNLKMYFNSSKL